MTDPALPPASPVAAVPPTNDDLAIPEARATAPRSYPTLVWLIPILAALIGASIVVKKWMSEGPTVTITFRTAEGIEPGRTRVRYKDVDIGKVTGVTFGDKGSIVVSADIARKATPFLRADSRFWVVRPQVGASGISGIGTLFSGSYISMAAGKSTEESDAFTGLEVAPINVDDSPGRQFRLHAENLGSLDVGSPVLFRQIKAGRVVGYQVDRDGRGVTLQVFVDAPYVGFIGANTRFWQASGVKASYGAEGLKLGLESIAALVVGGLAFETPPDAPSTAVAAENTVFKLFDDRTQAMKRVYKRAHVNVLYFKQTLRGLAVGAPVEFRGLVIGEVLGFGLEYNRRRGQFRVPVRIATYPELTAEALVAGSDLPDDSTEAAYQDLMDTLIRSGVRAQLASDSLITGQQHVALDYFPNAPPARIDWSQPVVALPTVPGGIDQLTDTLQGIATKIDRLPLDRLVNEVSTTVRDLDRTVRSADALVVRLKDEVAPEARAAIADARKTLGAAQATLDQDSPTQSELRKTLKQLTRAARALGDLSEYLERHPESLIRGKPDEPN